MQCYSLKRFKQNSFTFALLVLYKEKDSNRKCFPADDKKNMSFMNLFSKLWTIYEPRLKIWTFFIIMNPVGWLYKVHKIMLLCLWHIGYREMFRSIVTGLSYLLWRIHISWKETKKTSRAPRSTMLFSKKNCQIYPFYFESDDI